MSKQRVAIIFGGVSSEHEVSLMSATSIINNIPEDKYEVVCLGITKKGRWLYYPGDVSLLVSGKWENHPDCVPAFICPDANVHGIVKLLPDGSASTLKIDVAFPVLHGKNGEDGTIQGLFALAGIPFVGCDTASSAVCMDKVFTKTIMDQNGIPNAKWLYTTKNQMDQFDEFAQAVEEKLHYPVFVKPANAGSSVGVNKATDKESLKSAVQIALANDSKVLVEEAIVGKEIECAVLGNENPEASLPGEIVPCNEFYDYEAKYLAGTSELHIPARVDKATIEKIRETAIRAYKVWGCSGLARVDFFVRSSDGAIILNEPNTLPGFTSISMYPKLFEYCGIPYPRLIDQLIQLALERADNTNGQ